jgi:hypothetical protein
MLASCTSGSPATSSSAGAAAPVGAAAIARQGVNVDSTTPSVAAPTAGTAAPRVVPVGGSPASAPAMGSPEGAAPVLPCAVSKLLVTNCQSCHGATPIGGAPMSLVTYADLHKPAVTKPSMKVYELAKLRLNDAMKPMPPGGKIAPADATGLDTWLGAGALPGTEADVTCAAGTPAALDRASVDGSTGALIPEAGETCYEFKNHQSNTSVDDVPYDVGGPGEHYEQFYFRAPWPTGTVATRFGAKYDNVKVLHHWLMFSTIETDPEGSHKTSPVPTLIGVGAQLLAGWAVGGTNLVMPKDVGFELPPKGNTINIQWHFYNSTMTDQKDASIVQICTVPAAMRAHVSTVTWTGTEDLNGNKFIGGGKGMPPHMKSTFQGTCNPSRTGLAATEPVHIIAFWPHMHRLGVNMKAVINHKDGMKETILDKPFDFNNQEHLFQNYDLMPGDTMTTICDFNNTTDKGVPFGESSDTEMCYLFTFAWPAHAFENHVASLIGASNTCW